MNTNKPAIRAILLGTLLLSAYCAQPNSRKLLAGHSSLAKLKWEIPCEVYEVHMSLAEDQVSVIVAWRTVEADCPSHVEYGLASRVAGSNSTANDYDPDLNLKALGTSYSITEQHMCSGKARESKFAVVMHMARLTGLQPDALYYYRMPGSRRTFTFRSPIGPGSDLDFSFIAFGDMGESERRGRKSPMAAQTVKMIEQEMDRQHVDMILHIGDLAYADGRYKVWDSFMRQIEPVASRAPYMVGVGNHEYDFIAGAAHDLSGATEPYHPPWGNFGEESGGECGAMTARRFTMPNVRAATDNAPFWYSFDYGSVHFVVISTEHDVSPGSTQYRWLAADLAAVDRCKTPWVVLGMHRPMYVVFPHKENRVVGDHLRDFFESLLREYKVDLTLAGHQHTYYRSCPVFQEKCMQDGSGVTHFIIGTGGHELSGAAEEQKDWVAGSLNDWGFVRFDVSGSRMRARFVRSATGEVADEVQLYAQVDPSEDEACRAARKQG